jgi:hypothetical protein
MKSRVIGFASFVVLSVLIATVNVRADGFHNDQDQYAEAPSFSADLSQLVFNQHPQADAINHDSDNDMHFDHTVAWSSGYAPIRDCGCGTGDSPTPAMPEPSSLILLAAGLTPLLWRRRSNGV